MTMSGALGVSTIDPPELKKILENNVVDFKSEYERDERRIEALNESLDGDKKLKSVPKKSCIAAELLALLVFNRAFVKKIKKVKDVTETALKASLDEQANVCDSSMSVHL